MADKNEIAEREKWYEEALFGLDDEQADLAWEMLKNDKEVDPKLALGFVYIPAGKMVLGSDKKEREIKEGFWMHKYNCTQRMWNWVLGENPSYFKGNGALPVEQISFDDIMDRFIPALNKIFPTLKFDLPNQYEFEYAARGADESKGYNFPGSDNIDEVAWYADNSDGHTHPVGQKKPNEKGIYDCCGNTFEWVKLVKD